MSDHSYEIEIKTLLGNKENAEKLFGKMKAADPKLRLLRSTKQLNHYFIGGDIRCLYEKAAKLLNKNDHEKFGDILKVVRSFSLRTRTHLKNTSNPRCERFCPECKARRGDSSPPSYGSAGATQRSGKTSATLAGYGQFRRYLRRLLLGVRQAHLCRRSLVSAKLAHIAGGDISKMGSGWSDGEVHLVLKLTVDDTTSDNGTARIELDAKAENSSQDDLDKIVLSCGFNYQAKWSRKRDEYEFLGTHVSLDDNAGYGWLAEFEMVVKSEEEIGRAKARLREIVVELGLEELDQARLERMFAFYNAHWQEYYVTDKVFVVE